MTPLASDLGTSWQAELLERVCQGRREIAKIEAAEVRVLADLLMDAEGSAGEDAIDAGDVADVTRRHDLKVRSLATELAASLKISVRTAEQRLAEAWTLANELRATLAALEAGDISRAHAHEIITETAHLPSGSRVAAEAALLPWAKKLGLARFRKKAAQVLETLETESLRRRHERAFAKRHIELTPARDGMAHLDAYLELSDAARIKAGLENAAQEARAAGDARTGAQLEADFAVELLLDGQITIGSLDTQTDQARSTRDGKVSASPAREARTAAVKHRAAVTVDVLIPAETLAGKNDQPGLIPGLGVIDPFRARELVALAPSLRRILTDPITSAILDFDRTTYRVPAELKRVLKLRDQHCRAPGCGAPPKYTELDHSIAYARGGTTALTDLAHLCKNHHVLKHQAGWSLRQYLDGVLDWRAPSGRTYRTYPELTVPTRRTDPWNPPDTGEPAPFDGPKARKAHRARRRIPRN
ncbi:HNH endonuclease signature motif containing protein [Gryllotalpicola daejeonensis]|uniref:HNH endonuclease signature motif containing protein n=1 Tax=Gryllotalpicola daejeonensis TaxID=993087 RepID=UPI0031E103E9